MSGLYMWFLCLGDNVLYIITTKTAFHESCRRGAPDESVLWRWRLSCPVQKIVTSSTFNTPSHPDFKGSIKVCFYLSFSNRNWFHVFIFSVIIKSCWKWWIFSVCYSRGALCFHNNKKKSSWLSVTFFEQSEATSAARELCHNRRQSSGDVYCSDL